MALGTADSSLQVNAVYMPEQRLQLLSLCEAHWHSPKRKANITVCLRSGKLVINISIWNVFTLTLVNHLYEVSFESWGLIALILSPNRGFGVWWGLEMNSGRFAQFLVSCWQCYLWRRNHPNSNRQLIYAKNNLTFSGFHYVLKGGIIETFIMGVSTSQQLEEIYVIVWLMLVCLHTELRWETRDALSQLNIDMLALSLQVC